MILVFAAFSMLVIAVVAVVGHGLINSYKDGGPNGR